MVTVYLFASEDGGTSWKPAGLALAFLVLYLLSLSRSARVLEKDHEQLRRALS